mmetsp:Transcript_74779/g.216123  ORF Transcript_74779/g.216123 Transcript_74779/m.216123 type:complete len:176 (-) Transcript_74779:96-623(-)
MASMGICGIAGWLLGLATLGATVGLLVLSTRWLQRDLAAMVVISAVIMCPSVYLCSYSVREHILRTRFCGPVVSPWSLQPSAVPERSPCPEGIRVDLEVLYPARPYPAELDTCAPGNLCCICLDTMESGQLCITLSCCHSFHSCCIMSCSSRREDADHFPCPLCRLQSLPQVGEA